MAPIDKIEAGILARKGSRSFELLSKAPKNLDELVALVALSRTKLENLSTRAQGYAGRMAAAERQAREAVKDVIQVKQDSKLREMLNAARAQIMKSDMGDSERIAGEIATNHRRAQAVASRYRTPLGYLMVNTVTGEAAKARAAALALYATAGVEELAAYVTDAVQRKDGPALAAAAQRANGLAKDQRDAVMPLLRDAAEELVGADIRIAQAAILSLQCDALDSDLAFASIEGREVSSNARINAGVLRRDLAKVADAIDPPKPADAA